MHTQNDAFKFSSISEMHRQAVVHEMGNSGVHGGSNLVPKPGDGSPQRRPHRDLFLVSTSWQTSSPPFPPHRKSSLCSDCPTHLVRKPEAVATPEGNSCLRKARGPGQLAKPSRYKRELPPGPLILCLLCQLCFKETW